MNSNKLENVPWFLEKQEFEKYVFSCSDRNNPYEIKFVEQNKFSGVFLIKTNKKYVAQSIEGLYEVCWYKEGKLHREDGPAKISATTCTWYHENKIHRIGGAAFCFLDEMRSKIYFINGELLQEKDYWNHPEVIKHKIKKIIEL